MGPPRSTTAVATLALLVAGVVAVVALGGGPFVPEGPAAPGEPSLVGATSTGGHCVPTSEQSVSASVQVDDAGTALTITGNVTVPDANYALDSPSFQRVDRTVYVLGVASHEVTEKPPANCTDAAQATYTATVAVPENVTDLTIDVSHDGVIVARVHYDGQTASVSATNESA